MLNEVSLQVPAALYQEIYQDALMHNWDVRHEIVHLLQESLDDRRLQNIFFMNEINRLRKAQSDFVAGKLYY